MVSVTFSQAFSGGLAGEGPHPGPPNKILGPILGGGGGGYSLCIIDAFKGGEFKKICLFRMNFES